MSVGDLSIDFDLDELPLEMIAKNAFNPRGINHHHDDSHNNDASMSSISCSCATLGASLSSLCSTRWESEHTKTSAGSGPARRVSRSRSGSLRRVQRVKSFDKSSPPPSSSNSSTNKVTKVGSSSELQEHAGIMLPRRPALKNIPNRRVFRNTSWNGKLRRFETAPPSSSTSESSACLTVASSYASLLSSTRCWESVVETSERSATEIDLTDSVASFGSEWRDNNHEDEAENNSYSASSSSSSSSSANKEKKKSTIVMPPPNPRMKRHNSASDALRNSSSSIFSIMQQHIMADDEDKVFKNDSTTMRSLFNREDSLTMPPRLPLRTTETS
jgi:hypothetical protein